MKHKKTVNEILALYHEWWMDENDRAEMDSEVLKLMGKTKEQLSELIEIGIKNGCSAQDQLEIIKKLIKKIIEEYES